MKKQKKIGILLIALAITCAIISTILIHDATISLLILIFGLYFLLTKNEIAL